MEEMKKGQLTIKGDGTMELSDDVSATIPGPTEEQKATVLKIGSTMKAYLDAAVDLLQGKYAHIKHMVPVHLTNPGTVLVVACPDGVAIRFDPKTDKRRIRVGRTDESLMTVAPPLSQNLIHCYTDRNYVSTVPTTGFGLKLLAQNPGDQVQREMVSLKVGFDVVIEKPPVLPTAPRKPFCLLSVHNSIELQMFGVLMDDNSGSAEHGQEFIIRNLIRLPVKWECVEIYPFFDAQQWKPEYASLWAENDILASVMALQFRENQFKQLDPNAATRRSFAELLKSYKALLDSNPEREETLQSFLRDHPSLLCPTHVKMWPKLPLGSHATDFVFQEAAGDYLLVEIERSTHRLFLKNGDQSRELDHARGQVLDWKRYIEDNLATVQRELGLSGISTMPKSMVVIGRSELLTPENRRKLISIENDSPKLKIMTYDDIYENAKAVIENLLGPIWNTGGNTEVYYLPKGESATGQPFP